MNEASGLLGTAYVRMGKFADALPRLEKAAPLDHMGNIHFQLYQAYRKLGEAESRAEGFGALSGNPSKLSGT